jgi:hypothetical protein
MIARVPDQCYRFAPCKVQDRVRGAVRAGEEGHGDNALGTPGREEHGFDRDVHDDEPAGPTSHRLYPVGQHRVEDPQITLAHAVVASVEVQYPSPLLDRAYLQTAVYF